MIEYEKSFGAFNLLVRTYGSAWPRVLVLSTPSVILSILLKLYAKDYVRFSFLNPQPYSLFGGVLAFLLIFRSNLSFARYWEGCTMLSQMSSKWGDAAIQVITFDEAAKEPKVKGGTQFRCEFVHSMSLMHALAMLCLRGDVDLDNLVQCDFFDFLLSPVVDSADIDGWVSGRGISSYFQIGNDLQKYWKCLPLPVLGGINDTELSILQKSHNKVYLVFCWIHRELVARRLAGGIKEDAPIVSRIYQVLSDGMLGFENAKKIRNTPFPFPYAQSVSLLLHINAIGCPLLMANWLGQTWLVAIATFVCVFSFYLINEVAREIEEPFKYEPNDLPLQKFHHDFNARLSIALIHSQFPSDGLFHHINDQEIKPMMEKVRPVIVPEPSKKSFSSHWTAGLGGASP